MISTKKRALTPWLSLPKRLSQVPIVCGVGAFWLVTRRKALSLAIWTISFRHSPPSCWLSTKVLIKVEALRAQLLPDAGKCWSIVFDKSNTWIVCASVISPNTRGQKFVGRGQFVVWNVHKRIKFGWLMRGLIAFGFHLMGETVFWLKSLY